MGSCLLVAGVDEVGEGLEGVGSAEAGVPVAGANVHGGIDHDGLDQLRDAHVLQDLQLVRVRQVLPVLQTGHLSHDPATA